MLNWVCGEFKISFLLVLEFLGIVVFRVVVGVRGRDFVYIEGSFCVFCFFGFYIEVGESGKNLI